MIANDKMIKLVVLQDALYGFSTFQLPTRQYLDSFGKKSPVQSSLKTTPFYRVIRTMYDMKKLPLFT
jgi:hypothetical protein